MMFRERPNTRSALIRRYEVANALSAVAPATAPTNDYQRGYVDALIRVGLVFDLHSVEEPTAAVVEVTR